MEILAIEGLTKNFYLHNLAKLSRAAAISVSRCMRVNLSV